MHSSKIAVAIAVLASPLALLTPATPPGAGMGVIPVAGPAVTESTVGGRPLTDAPVPGVGPAGLPPVDRAAQPGTHSFDAGPINGTPFSATPSGTLSEGGTEADQHDRSFSASDTTGVVPNLGK